MKSIVGVYETPQETIAAIEGLLTKGYDSDEIYVERRPVDENKADASPVNDSEEIRVPIVEEKLEVTKKPVVTDEVVVGKRTVEENEHISETVKKKNLV